MSTIRLSLSRTRAAFSSLAVVALAHLFCQRLRKPASEIDAVKATVRAAQDRQLVLQALFRANNNKLFDRALTVKEVGMSAFLAFDETGHPVYVSFAKVESVRWKGEVRIGGFTPAPKPTQRRRFGDNGGTTTAVNRAPTPPKVPVNAAAHQEDACPHDGMVHSGAVLMGLLAR